MRDHCHRARSEGVDLKARRKLIIASILCLVFMIAEIVGEYCVAVCVCHRDLATYKLTVFVYPVSRSIPSKGILGYKKIKNSGV